MIYIEVLGKTWRPGKDLGLRRYREFEKWLSRYYVFNVIRAINHQTYRASWPPLTKSYLEYKKERGWSLNTWEATSELKKSLRVKGGNRLIVGYDGRRRHKESHVRLLDIAVRLEFGSVVSNLPPRPLFRPVLREMQKNLKSYYLKYLGGAKI